METLFGTPPPMGWVDQERDTARIAIATLNVGAASNVMEEDGHVKQGLLDLLDTLQDACDYYIVFLTEFRGKKDKAEESRWGETAPGDNAIQFYDRRYKRLRQSIHVARSNVIVGRLSGPSGVLLIHSSPLPGEFRYEVLGEDAVTIHLKWERGGTLVVHGVYFPFRSGMKEMVTLTLERITQYALEHLSQVVIGDLNMGQEGKPTKEFSEYEAPLYQAGLLRLATPPTGFDPKTLRDQGGAQAIWGPVMGEVLDTKSVRVLHGLESLSNCHRPLMVIARAPTHEATAEKIIRPSISKQNRTVPNRAALATALNQMGRIWPTLPPHERAYELPDQALGAVMQSFTDAPQKLVSLATKWKRVRERARRKKGVAGNPRGRARLRSEAFTRTKVRAQIQRRRKVVMTLVVLNTTELARRVFGKPTESIVVEEPNRVYAQALQELSFVLRAVESELFSDVPEGLVVELHKISGVLRAAFTSEEVREARKKAIRRTTTYNDYPAHMANLMGEPALEMVGRAFDSWLDNPKQEVEVPIIGIPTGKAVGMRVNDAHRYLQKALRPIGIFGMLRAWFHCCLQLRLKRVVDTIAAPNMYASVTGREAHDVIIQMLLRVDAANENHRPLYIIKADLVKAWDRIQHDAVAALDGVTGDTGFFAALAAMFASVTLTIKVHSSNPVQMKPASGGTQGNGVVPALWALLCSPVAHRLNAHAAEDDPTFMTEAVEIFADDNIIVSTNLERGLHRFTLARNLYKRQGQDLEVVAIAFNGIGPGGRRDAFKKADEMVTFEGKSFKLEAACRILGACVHLRPGPCSQRKCKRCAHPATVPYCQGCEVAVKKGAWGLDIPLVDASLMVAIHVTTATTYACYSCLTHREWAIKFQEEIRGPLHGPKNGGYVEMAHLAARLGGLGMKDVARDSAVELTGIMDRILAREGRTRSMAVEHARAFRRWPRTIRESLKYTNQPESEHKDPFEIQIRLHHALTREGSSQGPRAVEVAWRLRARRLETEGTRRTRSEIVAIGVGTDGGVEELSWYVIHEDSREASAKADIRLLGAAMDHLGRGSSEIVTLKALPPHVKSSIKMFQISLKKHLQKDRTFLEVLGRVSETRVTDIQISAPQLTESQECVHIPDAFPFVIRLNEGRISAGNIVYRLKDKLETQQLREAVRRRQLAELLHGAGDIMHEWSAVTAGVRTGAHYFSELTQSESNLLLRLRSGAVLKTGSTPDCSHKDCRGFVGDLVHILGHVSKEDVEEAERECITLLERTPGKLRLPNPIHPAIWLGFVTKDIVYWPGTNDPRELKKKQKIVMRIATVFARVGLALYARCHGAHPLVSKLGAKEAVFRREDFTGAQDKGQWIYRAAYDGGYNPENKVGSIGGAIWKDGELIYEYWAIVQGEAGASSTLMEYISELILTAATWRLKLRGILFEGDNMASVEQTEGEWHTAVVEQDMVREKIHHVLSMMGKEARRWVPREMNEEADRRAGRAMLRKEIYLHDEEYEILRSTLRMLWPSGKHFPKGTRRVQGA